MLIIAPKVPKKCLFADTERIESELRSETFKIVLTRVDLPGKLSRPRFEALFFELRLRGTRK